MSPDSINEGTAAIVLSNPLTIDSAKLDDWGPVARPTSELISKESGILMFRRQDRSSEMGMWQCTPGNWRCEVEKDEFCYFLTGKAIYTADSGEVTVVQAGDAGTFPAGWTGDCEVVETVRKVYMVR